MSAPEKNYKDTILLPETGFPMRGDLTKNEPVRLKKWEDTGLYERILSRRMAQGAPRFLLHDGPPFANGDVHMGTALNKILKDLVLKSKTMAGYAAPYIPGWDCHGLPIEFKVVQKARDLDAAEIRRRCAEFAKGFIDIQRTSFRRLGVFGDWENPYLTMKPAYEANILRVFAKLVEDGAVYQSRKPVQWSYGAYTALAEAEIDYKEKVSSSVFVRFPLLDNPLGLKASMVIWTTTPWTLPANVGLALHPRFTYVAGRFMKNGQTENLVIVKDLLDAFAQKTGWALAETIREFKGAELENCEARHPFLSRTSTIILADFVTTDTGTGIVHIAPGHGADDYNVGRQYGLPVLSPVDDDGKYTEEVGVPSLVGKHVFDANKDIISMLEQGNNLFGVEEYRHQYPHCWRSKTPIIFRAVEQFFISMDKLRPQALEEIDKVQWLPAWGRNRIYGTVEARPDWCISRQRTWGVPLPVFFDENGKAVLDAALVRKIADMVEKHGSNIWFELSDEDLCERLGLPKTWKKGKDTLDVWIDSGSSHMAVMDSRPGLDAPADLYLEATDQHRGWFQSSLMLSVAWRGKAPYKAVMTHGFVVDKDTGKKTSKSDAKSGKPIDAAYYYDKYGADIVRLWAASVDWQNEVPFGEDLFKQVTEPYRRLRNTLRILLGNISGFDFAAQAVAPEHMPILDRWILERLNAVIRETLKAYEAYDFRKAFSAINQFCTSDLSALYVDTTKDRLYCTNGVGRKAAQTTMYKILVALDKIIAPILCFTSQEIWDFLPKTEAMNKYVVFEDMPKAGQYAADDAFKAKWAQLIAVRDEVKKVLEQARADKQIGASLEASVTLYCNDAVYDLLNSIPMDELADLMIVSHVELVKGEGGAASAVEGLGVAAAHATGDKCERCWKYSADIGTHSAHPTLCARCASVVEG